MEKDENDEKEIKPKPVKKKRRKSKFKKGKKKKQKLEEWDNPEYFKEVDILSLLPTKKLKEIKECFT
jgi:hypothetical protein